MNHNLIRKRLRLLSCPLNSVVLRSLNTLRMNRTANELFSVDCEAVLHEWCMSKRRDTQHCKLRDVGSPLDYLSANCFPILQDCSIAKLFESGPDTNHSNENAEATR
jgi:hypothetical protein